MLKVSYLTGFKHFEILYLLIFQAVAREIIFKTEGADAKNV